MSFSATWRISAWIWSCDRLPGAKGVAGAATEGTGGPGAGAEDGCWPNALRPASRRNRATLCIRITSLNPYAYREPEVPHKVALALRNKPGPPPGSGKTRTTTFRHFPTAKPVFRQLHPPGNNLFTNF